MAVVKKTKTQPKNPKKNNYAFFLKGQITFSSVLITQEQHDLEQKMCLK